MERYSNRVTRLSFCVDRECVPDEECALRVSVDGISDTRRMELLSKRKSL